MLQTDVVYGRRVYLFTDGAITILAGLVFRWEVALLATLTLILSGIVTDLVLEGVSQVRTATIVTNQVVI